MFQILFHLLRRYAVEDQSVPQAWLACRPLIVRFWTFGWHRASEDCESVMSSTQATITRRSFSWPTLSLFETCREILSVPKRGFC